MLKILRTASVVVGLSVTARLLVPQEASAQDACVSELRHLNELETANLIHKNPKDVCVYFRNQIKLETDYAALYRRCGNGMDAEIEAHQHEKSASNLQRVMANNCVGGRARTIDDAIRELGR
jgi:hypothetical protein